MGQAEQQGFWDAFDHSADLLGQAMDKLVLGAQESESEGLSGEFTEQAAMKLMERAMEALAKEYVSHLESFKEATEAREVLTHLEASETLWRQSARVIVRFDPSGEESKFINEMRSLAFSLFLEKLEHTSEMVKKDPSVDNVAACLGVMAVVDHVMGEQGRPVTDPERAQLRKVAASFR